jgi:hypothetical protein
MLYGARPLHPALVVHTTSGVAQLVPAVLSQQIPVANVVHCVPLGVALTVGVAAAVEVGDGDGCCARAETAPRISAAKASSACWRRAPRACRDLCVGLEAVRAQVALDRRTGVSVLAYEDIPGST